MSRRRSGSVGTAPGTVGMSIQKGPQAYFRNLHLTEGQGKLELPGGASQAASSSGDSGPAQSSVPVETPPLKAGSKTTDELEGSFTTTPTPLHPDNAGAIWWEILEDEGPPPIHDRLFPDAGRPPPRPVVEPDAPLPDGVVLPDQLRVAMLKCYCQSSDTEAARDIQRLAEPFADVQGPMMARVAVLRDMLQRAKEEAGPEALDQGAVSLGGNVHRLFVAPEWLFRVPQGNGPNGYRAPLTREDRDAIVEALRAISGDFPDWLIVPGSIFYAHDAGSHPHQMVNETMAILNGEVKSVLKKNEFDDLATYVTPTGETVKQGWAPAAGVPTGPSRFEIGGLKVALEICRDHIVSRALIESTDEVDVHIIISNGTAEVQTQGVVARHEGLLVQVDGAKAISHVSRVERLLPTTEVQALVRQTVFYTNRLDEMSKETERVRDQIRAREREVPPDEVTIALLQRRLHLLDQMVDNVKRVSEHLKKSLPAIVRLRRLYEGTGAQSVQQIPDSLFRFQRGQPPPPAPGPPGT